MKPLLHLGLPLLLAGFASAQITTQKISATAGGFTGPLLAGDRFGVSCAPLGDLDGDGVEDVAVGTPADDDGGANRGAVWILFLNANGTVKAEQKISDTAGAFFGILDNGDQFGFSLAAIGDIDGDGLTELGVGAIGDDDGGSNRGAVYVLFLNASGTVKASRKISQTSGGFFGTLANGDLFGSSITGIGDFNGDTNLDIAVGSIGDDDGGSDRGAVRLIALSSMVNVLALAKISDTAGGFGGGLADADNLGASLLSLGDLNGDTFVDIAVGAPGADDGGADRGAAYVLFLSGTGSVITKVKLAEGSGGVSGLADGDGFGTSLAWLSDRNGDGDSELAVGVPMRDDGGTDRGAFFVLDLSTAGVAEEIASFGETTGSTGLVLDDLDFFGRSVCELGDLDGDGYGDLFVGAMNDGDGGANAGAGYVMFLDCVTTASVASRNGTAVNPATFVSTSPPILGANWTATIDIVSPPALASFVQISLAGPSPPIPLSGIFKGELLIQPVFGPLFIATGSHSIPVPYDCTLGGLTFALQGGTFNPGCLQLTNALDLTFGTH